MKKISHGCTLDCFDACKFNIYIDNNDIVKIEGDKEHPFTKGFICKKGLAHLDRLKHEERLYKPLLKVDNKFIEISFSKALEILSEKLKCYKDNYSSKSIMYYEQYGNGSLLKSIGDIFFNFFGGVSKPKGGPCWSAGIAAQNKGFGSVLSHSLEDMINSKTIIVWGKNPAYTSIHTMAMIRKAKNNGSKVIVIDPILTKTAEIADIYIRTNVGSDIYLALAMAKIIIENNFIDKDFINDNVSYFNEFKDLVDRYSLNELSEKCGVSIKDIEIIVKEYIKKNSTILLGYGIQKYYHGGATIRAIDALAIITGQIGVNGGGVNYANKIWPSVLNCDPYESYKYGDNREFYTSHISDFISECNKGITYYKDNIYQKEAKNKEELDFMDIPLKMAVIVKSNLLNQLPNLNNLKDAMKNIEFKVCFDMFMTDTAKECDLIIPTTSTLESEDILFSSMTNPYIIYNEKAVEPFDEMMDEYNFFMELAKILNLKSYPKVSKKEYLSKVVEPLKDIDKNITIDNLKTSYFTINEDVPYKDKIFKTKSTKIELITSIEVKELSKNRFTLLTNHSKDTLFSQHFMDEEGISKAYINEKMAKNLEIDDNAYVVLKSDNGEIKVDLHIDNNISDNVVMMYVGWWDKHGNPNFLTSSGISDIGGQVTYNETKVDIVKR